MSRLRLFLFKTLIRLLMVYLRIDGEPIPKDTKIRDYLAGAWMTPGFRRYVELRDRTIANELAAGLGMTEHPRTDYTRMFGQRAEVLLLAYKAKAAWSAKDKEARQRGLSTPKPPEGMTP